MIVRAQEKVSKIPDAVLQRNRDLKIPIVRIRVDYSPDFPTVNPVTFGSKFIHRVANPHHLLIAQKTPKKRTPAASSGMQSDLIDGEEDSTPGAMATAPGSMADKIAREVHGYIRQKKHLGLLSEHHLTDATLSFIEKAETNAINTFVDAYVQRAQRGIWKDVRSRVDVTPDLVKKLANGIRQSVENDWQKANQSVAAPGVSRREESQAGKSSASSLFKRDSMIKEEELDDFAVPPPDAGQRGPAVDTQGTSSKIKLEDMDEDPDDMPAPPASALAPQRANATPDEISEQSNSLDVDALQPLPAVKKAARKKPAAKRAKASPKATTRRKRTAAEVDDSASEDEPAKKKKPAAKKASPKVSKGPQQLSLTSTAAVMANWGKKKKQ
ncbi:Double-strand break repair protein MRE11 [Diplonema papillatum]|nr:Double-strand break repair protein MRE11 [Diplonema papillatum]